MEDYNQPKKIQLLKLNTQLNKTNSGQQITKKCLILFSQRSKKVALEMKEKTLN